MFSKSIKVEGFDNELFNAIKGERRRQEEHIELIASENMASPRVLECQGSVLTNKYAEGYPAKRYYGGCEFVDVAEQLAISRAIELFGADWVNVQSHSGCQANAAVFHALLEPGDTIMGMSLAHGGHLTHGASVNVSGRIYNAVQYGLNAGTGEIDYDEAEKLALETKPKLIMMDEPFANLDERLKNKIRDITLHLLQKTFTTALIITHDPDDAMFMGDFIAIMNNGKILQFDTPENIYNNPSSSFVARFFGETLSIKSKVNNKKAKTIFGPINITNSKNGKEIEIVFRSEAFNITKNKSKNRTKKIKSRIIAVRYISDNSYLHLDILNNSFKKHIHIKVPGKFIPPKNKICYINIGKKNFFVF